MKHIATILLCWLMATVVYASDRRSTDSPSAFSPPPSDTLVATDTLIIVEPGGHYAIADALRAAREFRRRHTSPANYIAGRWLPRVRATIVLRPGTYRLIEPLTLRPEDSHTTLRGEPGAVIKGSARISGWRREGSLYVADLPDVNGRPLEARQLWVNGQKAVRARNVAQFNDMPRISWVDRRQGRIWVARKDIEPLVGRKALRAIADSGFVALPRGARYAEMVLHQMWEVSVLRLRSIFVRGDSAALQFCNPEQRLQFSRPWPSPMYGGNHNSPFYLTNALTLVDEPGEWYADPRTHRLYYMPRQGEQMESAEVEMPVLETLVSVEGTPDRPVSAVTFKHLRFGHTTWLRPSLSGHVPLQAGMYLEEAYKLRPQIDRPNNHRLDNQGWIGRPSAAVQLYAADDARFEDCTFSGLGGSGVDYDTYCHGGGLYGCTLTDIAYNGCVVGSFSSRGLETHLPYRPEDRRAICTNQTITATLLTDVGNEDWGCVAIAAGYVSHITITHNEISHVPYTGISLGWGWNRDSLALGHNLVSANYIHHYARHTYDCAGIYTLGNQPSTLITENVVDSICHPTYVHDPDHWFYLYTDEGSANITLSNNWTPSAKYLQNANGPGNVWTNNGPQVDPRIKRDAGLPQRTRGTMPAHSSQEQKR